MAIKLPNKAYLTVAELLQRWQCTLDDVLQEFLERRLVPSLYVMGEAERVQFVEGLPNACAAKHTLMPIMDEEGNRMKIWLRGWHYLAVPQRLPGGVNHFHCVLVLEEANADAFSSDVSLYALSNEADQIDHESFSTHCCFMLTEVARFEAEMTTETVSSPPSAELRPRERTTYLNIIAALVELAQTAKPGRDSEAALIRELIGNYGDAAGISKSNLEIKFAEAKRCLRSA